MLNGLFGRNVGNALNPATWQAPAQPASNPLADRFGQAQQVDAQALSALLGALGQAPPQPVAPAFRSQDLVPLGIAGLLSALAGNQGGDVFGQIAGGVLGGKAQKAQNDTQGLFQADANRRQAAQIAYQGEGQRADSLRQLGAQESAQANRAYERQYDEFGMRRKIALDNVETGRKMRFDATQADLARKATADLEAQRQQGRKTLFQLKQEAATKLADAKLSAQQFNDLARIPDAQGRVLYLRAAAKTNPLLDDPDLLEFAATATKADLLKIAQARQANASADYLGAREETEDATRQPKVDSILAGTNLKNAQTGYYKKKEDWYDREAGAKVKTAEIAVQNYKSMIAKRGADVSLAAVKTRIANVQAGIASIDRELGIVNRQLSDSQKNFDDAGAEDAKKRIAALHSKKNELSAAGGKMRGEIQSRESEDRSATGFYPLGPGRIGDRGVEKLPPVTSGTTESGYKWKAN